MNALAIGRDRLGVVLALALAALAMRDVAMWSFAVPLAGAVGVIAVQGRSSARVDTPTWVLVTAAGVAACGVVRVVVPGAPLRTTTLGLVASVLAALGEEIVFRRGLYGALERYGPAVAVVAGAVVFGLVHVPMYGWAVVPVDVGAGIVFGWQRWASGTWTSAGLTHAAANVMGAL